MIYSEVVVVDVGVEFFDAQFSETVGMHLFLIIFKKKK